MGLSIHTFAAERKNPYNEAAKEVLRYEKSNTIHAIGSACRFCKLFIGRIFQYGYTGTISTSWRSQNEGGDKLAHAVATQLLVWETIVGERDADFNKVGTGGKDAICDQVSTGHPLYIRPCRNCRTS